jgi:hypothetical protein
MDCLSNARNDNHIRGIISPRGSKINNFYAVQSAAASDPAGDILPSPHEVRVLTPDGQYHPGGHCSHFAPFFQYPAALQL